MTGSVTRARRFGRYLLCGEIASGGMATVCFGRLVGPAGFSRTVALKRLHAAYAKDPEFVAMFLDEARMASRVRHPNVVQVLDVVATEGELLLVLDYVQGEALSRLLREARQAGLPPPPAVASAIMADVLRGLHAAHEARSEAGEPLELVHRDISPQNILVHEDGMALVTDFGIARAIGRTQTTREGQLKGKPGYMAPEQILCDPVTRRTDVFAAGVVLWETLTGHRLFHGDSEIAVARKVLETRVDAPSRVRGGIPAAVDPVVLRALAQDPEARFATAAEMQHALERAVPSAPASAVATWVRSLAGDTLAQRAQELRRIESSSAGDVLSGDAPLMDGRLSVDEPPASSVRRAPESHDPSAVTAPTPLLTHPPRRKKILWGAVALLGGVVGAVAGMRVLLAPAATESPLPERVASPVTSAPEPVSVPVPVLASAKPSATGAAPAAELSAASPGEVVAPTATSSQARSSAAALSPSPLSSPLPRATPPRPAAAPGGCNPPYEIDARGVKVFKKQCLASPSR